ncbi:hypothetical protein GCM10008101_06760 [Lysobacter xinjiangensis]|uniref:Uncharacterized protein n=1 Tax=Cognatilysobacter xinjiangensis TaxID=546892 RepID=A0ABQ3BSB4_9GAMM|nr:hypothetical protein GCM10008101_06760 [Lysobacter xinjiangensis]
MAATIIAFPKQRRAEDDFVRTVRTDDELAFLRHNSDAELRSCYRNMQDAFARYQASRARK